MFTACQYVTLHDEFSTPDRFGNPRSAAKATPERDVIRAAQVDPKEAAGP